MKKIIFLQITFAALSITHMHNILASETQADDVATVQSEAVIDATAKTGALIENAMTIMDDAREQLFAETMDAIKVADILKEQVVLIAQAKQELKQTVAQAVEKVESEQGYLAYFVSGVKNIGSKIIAPFKTNYGYTQKEREMATKIIAGLEEQQDKLTREYGKLRQTKRLEVGSDYEVTIKILNDEINKQKLIGGDQIDTKKVFYAVALAGAAVAGMALMAPEESKAILQEQTIVQPDIVQSEKGDKHPKDKVGAGQSPVPPIPSEEITKGDEVLVTPTGLPQNQKLGGVDVSGSQEQKEDKESEAYLKSEQERAKQELEEQTIREQKEAKEKQKEHEANLGLFSEDPEKKLELEQPASNDTSKNSDELSEAPKTGTVATKGEADENADETSNPDKGLVPLQPGDENNQENPNQVSSNAQLGQLRAEDDAGENADDAGNTDKGLAPLQPGDENNQGNPNQGSRDTQVGQPGTEDAGGDDADQNPDKGPVLQQPADENLKNPDEKSNTPQTEQLGTDDKIKQEKIKELYDKLSEIQRDAREFLEENAGKGNEQADKKLQEFEEHKTDDYATLNKRIEAGEDLDELLQELESAHAAFNIQKQQLLDSEKGAKEESVIDNQGNSQPGQNVSQEQELDSIEMYEKKNAQRKKLYDKFSEVQRNERDFLTSRAGKGNEEADKKLQEFEVRNMYDYSTLNKRIEAGEDLDELLQELESAHAAFQLQKKELLDSEKNTQGQGEQTDNAGVDPEGNTDNQGNADQDTTNGSEGQAFNMLKEQVQDTKKLINL